MPDKVTLLSSIKLKYCFKNPLADSSKYSIIDRRLFQLKNKELHFIWSAWNITNISLIKRNIQNSNNVDDGSEDFNILILIMNDGNDEKFVNDSATNDAGDDNDDNDWHVKCDGNADEKYDDDGETDNNGSYVGNNDGGCGGIGNSEGYGDCNDKSNEDTDDGDSESKVNCDDDLNVDSGDINEGDGFDDSGGVSIKCGDDSNCGVGQSIVDCVDDSSSIVDILPYQRIIFSPQTLA